MDALKYIIGQPSTVSFRIRDDDGSYLSSLTGYEFTLNLTNTVTGETASYTVPTSSSAYMAFDLADVTVDAGTLITQAGKWRCRFAATLSGEPFNVTETMAVIITE